MTYVTKRLPVAAYLHCTKALEFTGMRKRNEIVLFEFLDPQGRGDEIEMELEQGRAMVEARLYASSQQFLKNKMYQALHEEAKY